MMKEMEMKRVPKLRFPEFTDDWEQRKLGELTLESSEYATLSSKLPLLTSSRSGLMYQNEYRGNLTTESEKTIFSVVPFGTCTYRHMSDDDIFHLNINTLEKGLVSREYPVFMASEDNVLEFIVQYINSSSKFRAFCAEQKKGGTRTRLYYKTLCEFSFMVTKSKEQQRIAEFFTDLDHLITLHQRKLKNLNVLKKGVMQKLFSQKIRFKADDGSEFPEWEEKKLDDVAVRVTRKNKDNITDIPLTISSADGLIDQRDFFNKVVASKDMSGYYLLKKGEFAYNKSYSKGYDFGSIKKLDLYAEGALSTLYICFALNKDENPDFYQKYFDSLFWYLELQKICAEGARNHGLLNVSTNEFFQMKLKVPSSKQEQKKIADCLSSLDEVIEKQKATVAAWEELKKGLLQQMFV